MVIILDLGKDLNAGLFIVTNYFYTMVMILIHTLKI